MRRRAVLAVVLLALAGGLAAYLAWRRTTPPELPAFMAARALALSAQLAQVEGPYHLLVGDSQAERLFVGGLCSAPVINAGLSGARADELHRFTDRLVLPRRARSVTLVVGTNDLLRRRSPAELAAQGRFRAEIGALVAGLGGRADTILVAALAPLDAARAPAFDTAAAPLYDAILREECARAGCRLVDLFADADAASPDGVHVSVAAMTAPGGVADRLRDAICPVR